MYLLKMAAKDSQPLGSRPQVFKCDLELEEAKQQALNLFRSSRRAWVSLESEDNTCLYLLSVCGAQQLSGSRFIWVAMPKFVSRKSDAAKNQEQN